MKKRNLITAIAAAAMMTLAMSMSAYAGQWQQNGTGWWYDNGNGTWPANTWQWIDGNGDGVSECYYFDGNGYLLTNTTTPDGEQVNADGAWITNGVVQTQGASVATGKSAEEILDYIQSRDDGRFTLIVDESKPSVSSGATNIKCKYEMRNCWTWQGYKLVGSSAFMCPIAFDENGYLLVNTTTPDGFYVNEYGVLEINGVEVVHSDRCSNFPWKLETRDKNGNVVDKNNCDLSNIDLWNTTHNIVSDGGAQIPFGKLVYMHTNSQTIDGLWKDELGYNYCAQVSKDLYPNTYGKNIGIEPKTFR